jgi:hypothetical protein
VFVVNHQFTNAPNTTQIASGAGRSSAAGNNAAIKSPNTQQQQSVGAGGTAKNKWVKGGNGGLYHGNTWPGTRRRGKEIIIVLNDQIVKLPRMPLMPRLPRWQAEAEDIVRAGLTLQLKVQEPNSSTLSVEAELL